MVETRELTAILATDVVVVSGFAGADEMRTLVLRRALRGDLFDPAISAASPPPTTSAPETLLRPLLRRYAGLPVVTD
jgi:hypothetical protein